MYFWKAKTLLAISVLGDKNCFPLDKWTHKKMGATGRVWCTRRKLQSCTCCSVQLVLVFVNYLFQRLSIKSTKTVHTMAKHLNKLGQMMLAKARNRVKSCLTSESEVEMFKRILGNRLVLLSYLLIVTLLVYPTFPPSNTVFCASWQKHSSTNALDQKLVPKICYSSITWMRPNYSVSHMGFLCTIHAA